MDSFLFFGLLLLIILLFIGIPIAITYFVYSFLKRKFPNKPFKYLAFLTIIFMIYLIWAAIFPPDDFYERDYKEVTHMDFPKDAEITDKTATYPDLQGDYISFFTIEMPASEFDKLENHLRNSNFK